MLTPLDYVVIVLYLAGTAAIGVYSGGKQRNTTDYFLGSHSLPWWAVCFSIIATETSTLTVISIPAIAFGGSMTFLQLTFGYLIGRILVAMYLLPRYFEGKLVTAYAFLGQRFGDRMRVTASLTFIFTRLLADGVRLFATAIPVKVIADATGFEVGYFEIIAVMGVVTIVYTYIGGIKAVVWMDVVQMGVYLGGAIASVLILLDKVPAGWLAQAIAEGKTQVLDLNAGALTFGEWLTRPYTFVTAVVGGLFLSMASHGTDHLIVQRLLACRTLGESRKAMIGSGVFVIIQFALFLWIGLLLWAYYGTSDPQTLGLTRGDEVFPRFISEGLPPGLSGLMLAGILAAAMSTVASSLNSLASSTMLDLYERLSRKPLEEAQALRRSRVFTLIWGLVFIVFANLFRDQTNPVVELGLQIASFTYGGLLGVFLLGLLNLRARQADALVAFGLAILVMTGVIFGLWYHPVEGWKVLLAPDEALIAAQGLRSIAWPWYTTIGAGVTLLTGSLMALRHR
jgi:SSS family transporter